MRLLLVSFIIFLGTHSFAAGNSTLDSLLIRRHFFALKRELQRDAYATLPEYRRLYYQAFLHNFFHDLSQSNTEIEQLLTTYKKEFTNSELINLLMKKIDNHVKLYQYKEAHQATQFMLSKYRRYLSPEERDDTKNSDIIWKGLQHVPPQTTQIDSNTNIPYRRDLAGLINIPVQFADSSFDFIFDTGANLSVINETYARKTGLQLLGVHFRVRAITGIEVMANLGVAREFHIGGIVIRNAVFMVFPDSALSFARGKYTIKGILGFPVIEQLQEVRILKNTLMVPQAATDRPIRNFGVDELLPIVTLTYKTDTLAFSFDTGAQFTFLNESFYRNYKTMIDSTAESFDMQVGGAGGISKIKAWRLPQITFAVAGQATQLKDVAIKTSSATPKERLYFGNLGQDVMNQFREVVINFRYMFVDFVR